ncbi:MAG: deoxyribonuclease IV [Syntrophales bacterium]|jgi:deoxyribonuclease-4|nr:deoxyribonuclease IV [Syntrophales bacterium]MDY0043260.1 deoxyribonuclease IV [Syntrophales bacterium]
MKRTLLLGAHTSAAGGLEKALHRGNQLGIKAVQLFTKNANSWRDRHLQEKEIESFRKEKIQWGIDPVISHVSYLVNPASGDKEIREKSHKAMVAEITRCEALGIQYLIVHPGSHRGDGKDVGIQRITEFFERIWEEMNEISVSIILESMAGQGTSIGSTFEEIARIMYGVHRSIELAFCFDICHIFAAGHEIRNRKAYEEILEEVDKVIGIHRLKVIHLSDSKKECGSTGMKISGRE